MTPLTFAMAQNTTDTDVIAPAGQAAPSIHAMKGYPLSAATPSVHAMTGYGGNAAPVTPLRSLTDVLGNGVENEQDGLEIAPATRRPPPALRTDGHGATWVFDPDHANWRNLTTGLVQTAPPT